MSSRTTFYPLTDPAQDRAIMFGLAMESAAKAGCFAIALGHQLAIHESLTHKGQSESESQPHDVADGPGPRSV